MGEDGSHLTSSEIARLLGVSPATVRRWAEEGLLQALRTPGGHRRFPREDVERLARQHQLGHAAHVDRWMSVLRSDSPLAVDSQLMADRHQLGAWCRVGNALGAVFEELGRAWEAGELSVLDEHLATSRLLAGLTRAADLLPVSSAGPVALLATPPGERHTLGLAVAALALRERGWRTWTAGADLPLAEIERAGRSGEFSMIGLSASRHSPAESLADVHRALADASNRSGTALVVGGAGLWPDPVAHGLVERDLVAFGEWAARRGQRRAKKSENKG